MRFTTTVNGWNHSSLQGMLLISSDFSNLQTLFPFPNNIKLFFGVNASKLKVTRFRNEWVYISPKMCDLRVMTVKQENVLMVLLEERLLTSGF